jgi:anti-sigma regulatory factor (Ser/Thr protein kinase)
VVPPPDEVRALLSTAGVTERVNLAPTATVSPAGDFVERFELRFPREPETPARARAEVRDALGGVLDEAQLANAVLLTSELVTNAVVHPNPEVQDGIGLRITMFEDGVRVEVDDAGTGFDPAAPIVKAPDGGRGLFLVDACSTSWGTRHEHTHRGRRFRVWFELLTRSAETARA